MTLEEAKKIICELDSGSGFFGSDYEAGFSDVQNRVLGILDEIDTEPVGNPDKMQGYNVEDFLRGFTFLDGTPCGKLVEEE